MCEPVIDFYRHYLGPTSEPALAHPLAILDGDTGRHYLRAPLVWDEEEGAATFFGSVAEGSTVQIAMASTEEILDGTGASVQEALDGFPEHSRPEGALISACAVRSFLLGTRTTSEVERIKEGLGPDMPITGFYANGEFAPLGGSNAPKFHNETCVTVLIGTVTDDTAQQTVGDSERQIRTLRKRLARAELKTQSLETLQDQNSYLMRALMADLDAERAKSEELLLNILPAPIAERLKTGQTVIADRYESVSVLFSDIVGFTPLSENLTPEEMVEWLNEVYSAVDAMVTEHGVEKIRTIGDGYMCAAGVPVPREDHATILTNLALAMKAHFEELAPVHGHKAEFRIGINSGPVVGGVIGTLKFQYDIWGTPSTRRPAWNLMESRGGSTFHPRLIFSFKIPMCASRAGPSRSREKAQWRPGSSRHRSDPDTASCPAGYPKQPLGSSSQAIHHVRLGRNARRPPGLTGSCMGY